MAGPSRSFVGSLCLGQIDDSLILPFPSMSGEQAELVSSVLEAFDALLEPHAESFREWDTAGEFPPELIEELKEFGAFGLVIPEEFGGMGFGATAYSRTLQQIGKHDASVAVTIGAHSSIGMRGLLLFGTDEQKARFLPALATGEQIAAFCLTEPGAGSDAASVRTTAVRDGDEWVLNGTKLWITNGGIADFFTVFAKTGDAEERRRMSAFIVTRDMPGVTIGPHEDKMGLRASSTTSVYFDDVRVPAANLLGEENAGFKVAMQILNSGRTGLGGGCVGGMKRMLELATGHAKERVQFGVPIAQFGMIKGKIGQMVVDCYAAESAVNIVNGLIDRGHDEYAVEAAISKVFASEALWRSADEALQIAGGTGFMREYPYERVVRDSRINRIFEGTNEVLRLFIALTTMNEVGRELKDLGASLSGIFDDPIKGFGVLSGYAQRRASMATGLGSQAAAFSGVVPELREEAAAYERATRRLASAVDRVLRKHGKNIIGKQFASKRLADAMIDMFVLGCVISRVSTAIADQGAGAVEREIDILRVFQRQALERVEDNFAHVDNNVDETLKAIADHAVAAGGFSWDNLP
ncbi:MAG: acyl-CoA dehydrogenase family protein 9 [Myxococcota bacterium]